MSLTTLAERGRRPATLAALALSATSGAWAWAADGTADERFAPLHVGGLGLAVLALVVVAVVPRISVRVMSWLFAVAGLSIIAAMGSGVGDLGPRALGWTAAVVAMAMAAVAATAAADAAQNQPVSRL